MGNKKKTVVLLSVMILSWIVFKLFYPRIDFNIDSYTYINVAKYYDVISYRPIGYSVFLRLLHFVTTSDYVLATLQYLLFQGASLALFFTVREFYRLERPLEILVLGCILLDPFAFYLSNIVMSDSLFASLSLFWITTLLWLIRRPSWWLAGLQLLLLYLAFYVRYSAMFYPVLAALAFVLTRKNLVFKISGIAATFLLIFLVRAHIKNLTFGLTGKANFTAFTGWQLANNAMHVYLSLPVDTTGFETPEVQDLSHYVQRYFNAPDDSLYKLAKHCTCQFMWYKTSPLRLYWRSWATQHYPADTSSYLGMVSWNGLAGIYSSYGKTVIKKHPIAFARYYLWPSAKTFFVSDLDVFQIYNQGHPELLPLGKEWFNLRSVKVDVCSFTIEAKILAPIPWIFFFLNLLFLAAIVLYFSKRSYWRENPDLTSGMILVALFIAANTCFSIYATPSMLRYQGTQFVLLLIFSPYGLSAWDRYRLIHCAKRPRGS